jgi:hypothetical protein
MIMMPLAGFVKKKYRRCYFTSKPMRNTERGYFSSSSHALYMALRLLNTDYSDAIHFEKAPLGGAGSPRTRFFLCESPFVPVCHSKK